MGKSNYVINADDNGIVTGSGMDLGYGFAFTSFVIPFLANCKFVLNPAFDNLHTNDIENPFENKMEDIKTGKKHYALKGCGTLHCHGPKGRGSGGPALNEGKFKHSDGSNYALLNIITNGIKGTRMAAFGQRMPPDEILKIIAYLRWETEKLKAQ